jgi:hypothetical protein
MRAVQHPPTSPRVRGEVDLAAPTVRNPLHGGAAEGSV